MQLKLIKIRYYVVPVIAVVSTFLILTVIIISQIKDHFVDDLHKLSFNLAQGYSNSLTKMVLADEVVNQLLAEKLSLSGRIIAEKVTLDEDYDLDQLLIDLDVDEINIYNRHAIINASSTDNMVGWEAFDGHPVKRLFVSDKQDYIEEIRPNMVTRVMFKYGYFKLNDNLIVQLGLSASRVQAFLDAFKMNYLFKDILKSEGVTYASYINNAQRVIQSSKAEMIGNLISEPFLVQSLEGHGSFGQYQNPSRNVYDIYIPIHIEEERMGTLLIGHSTQENDYFMTLLMDITLIGLAILFGAFSYALILIYRKNKALTLHAYYDGLTGLPNVQYLKLHLQQVLRRRDGHQYRLCMININQFKRVNMLYGFDEGDRIINIISKRIKGILYETSTLYHLSGDRFVLLVKGKDLVFEELCRKLQNVIARPFIINTKEHVLTSNIGVIQLNQETMSVNDLLRNLGVTVDAIKDDKTNHVAYYQELFSASVEREHQIESELREIIYGIKADRFTLHYQPQLDVSTNAIQSFEALARFTSSTLGPVSPVEFIEIAEKKGLILDLGQIILEKACQFVVNMNKHTPLNLRVAVNISGVQFLQVDFVERVMETLDRYGVHPSQIELEITESILMNDFSLINQKCADLNTHGIRISLDDFGTGYSSFFRLHEMNIQVLKIDKAFIRNIQSDTTIPLVTDDMISMAHKFGLVVVAEGVEESIQVEYLRTHACDVLQGYHIGRPMQESDALNFIKA